MEEKRASKFSRTFDNENPEWQCNPNMEHICENCKNKVDGASLCKRKGCERHNLLPLIPRCESKCDSYIPIPKYSPHIASCGDVYRKLDSIPEVNIDVPITGGASAYDDIYNPFNPGSFSGSVSFTIDKPIILRPVIKEKEEPSMSTKYSLAKDFTPKKIIYSGDKTIVLWEDGTKTIVSCSKDQQWDEYSGFCSALTKKIYGTNSAIHRLVKQKSNIEQYKKEMDANNALSYEDLNVLAEWAKAMARALGIKEDSDSDGGVNNG